MYGLLGRVVREIEIACGEIGAFSSTVYHISFERLMPPKKCTFNESSLDLNCDEPENGCKYQNIKDS